MSLLNINCTYDDLQLFLTFAHFYNFLISCMQHVKGDNSKFKITPNHLKELMNTMFTCYKDYKFHDLYCLLRSSSKDVITLCLRYVKKLFQSENPHKISPLSQILLAFNSFLSEQFGSF